VRILIPRCLGSGYCIPSTLCFLASLWNSLAGAQFGALVFCRSLRFISRAMITLLCWQWRNRWVDQGVHTLFCNGLHWFIISTNLLLIWLCQAKHVGNLGGALSKNLLLKVNLWQLVECSSDWSTCRHANVSEFWISGQEASVICYFCPRWHQSWHEK